jgi:hypothetical protein
VSDKRTLEEAQGSSAHCAICDLRMASPHESVLLASKLWTATLARDVPGWIMVMLNRHNGDWLWGLSHQEAQELGPLMQRPSAALPPLAAQPAGGHPGAAQGSGPAGEGTRPSDPEEALRTGSRMRGRLAAPA